jgi:hypothetical protein
MLQKKRLKEKPPALQKEQGTLQNMKFLFPFLGGHFGPPEYEHYPLIQLSSEPIQIRYVSETLALSIHTGIFIPLASSRYPFVLSFRWIRLGGERGGGRYRKLVEGSESDRFYDEKSNRIPKLPKLPRGVSPSRELKESQLPPATSSRTRSRNRLPFL